MTNPSSPISVADVLDVLTEVREAAARQLAMTGKGIEPSPRLQEAFDAADRIIAKARSPHVGEDG